MVCETCRESMSTDARFCCHCGKPFTAAPAWSAFAGRLVRPREGRMLGGVCAGIAATYGWDPVLVRIAAVVMFFGGFGALLLVYLAAWIIMPNAPLRYVAPVMPQAYSGDASGSVPVA